MFNVFLTKINKNDKSHKNLIIKMHFYTDFKKSIITPIFA